MPRTIKNIDYFSVDSWKLVSYQPSIYTYDGQHYYISFNTLSKNLYFNGRLIVSNSAVVVWRTGWAGPGERHNYGSNVVGLIDCFQ